jgi:hypothetical protein
MNTELQAEIFGGTARTKPPDLYNLAAQLLRGMPPDWRWCKLESINTPFGRFTQVTGAVPTGIYSHGSKKGRPKWPAKRNCNVLQFSPAEIEQVRLKWEDETGKCSACGGDGQELFKISIEGNSYHKCRRCGGTGVAPKQTLST